MKTWEEMSARKRDALVAKEVMGWKVMPYASDHDGWGEIWNALDAANGDDPVGVLYESGLMLGMGAYDIEDGTMQPWSPTENIAAAWEVVEKVGGVTLMTPGAYTDEGLGPQEDFSCSFAEGTGFGTAWSETSLPEAICLAALRAVGVDI